jgi:hypothetical protein
MEDLKKKIIVTISIVLLLWAVIIVYFIARKDRHKGRHGFPCYCKQPVRQPDETTGLTGQMALQGGEFITDYASLLGPFAIVLSLGILILLGNIMYYGSKMAAPKVMSAMRM